MLLRMAIFALLAVLLTPLSGAATPARPNRSRAHKTAKRLANPAKVQQYHSFIPAYQPSQTITRLQSQLTGRVVEQAQPPAEAPQPRYVQIFLAPEEQAALEASKTPHTTATPTAQHHIWHILHFASKRPKKLRIQPEAITAAHSYVVPLTAADAGQLCGLIASFIQEQIQNTQTTLLLADVPISQAGNMLTLSLHYALKNLGYTVVQTQESHPISIRYRISNLDKALLVQVKVNGVETARLYERSCSGALAAASPTSRINRSEP